MEKINRILEQLEAEAKGGKMVFPTHMEMALRVCRAIEDPESSLEQLSTLIRAEPLLAARTVAMANSVIYNRSGRPITDVEKAISWVGLKTLSGLAMSLIVRQMQEMSALPAHSELASKLWDHTAQVASLAYVLAKRITLQDPNVVFFAGIVHEVGGFYLISRAASFPGLLEAPLEGWYRSGEVRLGRAVLKALEVPEPVVEAIESMWEGSLMPLPVSLGDTLQLAVRLAHVSPLDALSDRVPEVGDGADIDFALGDGNLSGIMEDSAEEVASLIAVLKS